MGSRSTTENCCETVFARVGASLRVECMSGIFTGGDRSVEACHGWSPPSSAMAMIRSSCLSTAIVLASPPMTSMACFPTCASSFAASADSKSRLSTSLISRRETPPGGTGLDMATWQISTIAWRALRRKSGGCSMFDCRMRAGSTFPSTMRRCRDSSRQRKERASTACRCALLGLAGGGSERNMSAVWVLILASELTPLSSMGALSSGLRDMRARARATKNLMSLLCASLHTSWFMRRTPPSCTSLLWYSSWRARLAMALQAFFLSSGLFE
mmetsp:Transcript_11745/g.30477  ORF Transcript_11745/g.30477 Transcript_11745/m.30477 type:complete len:271 (-) Transcript_11745:963-1775(-)